MPKKKILIIDDEVGFTRMVKLNLEKTGEFEIREVNQAPAAVSVAREFKPDLILLDVIMPAMDGGDIRARMQADPRLKDIPVIFVTAALSPRETAGAPQHSGGEQFLAKPVSFAVLLACIRQNLSASSPPPLPGDSPRVAR